MKFKVGDLVRVIILPKKPTHRILEASLSHGEEYYRINYMVNSYMNFFPEELELVQPVSKSHLLTNIFKDE